MTDIISTDDRGRIRKAVGAAESKTSGEIFVVVARRSDDYRFIPIMWATLIALIAPFTLIYATSLPASFIYMVQLGVFAVMAIILSLPAVRPQVVPGTVKHARSRALAVELFLSHGLHTTEARTGVLIFVSLAERHAEIVADTLIASRVDQATWDAAMARLIDEVRSGRLSDGLIAAVEATGAELARHFPPRSGDVDELPNDVIIL